MSAAALGRAGRPAVLRVGSRGSALATAQARLVIDRLAAAGQPATLVEVTTHGDVDRRPLTAIGGTGVFVSALRERLLAGDVDLAVHSLKDLPTVPAPGIRLAAVPPRADPRDALVSRAGWSLADLPAGCTVGTGAPRRAAQLLRRHPGLVVTPVRGNVDTRLGRVRSGELDAVVVALAGLARLGRLDAPLGPVRVVPIDPADMLPAPGQGALAVECRAGDDPTAALLAGLDDAPARAAVTAERAVLAGLTAGCSAPVGALASANASGGAGGADSLVLRAIVCAGDGGTAITRTMSGPLADPARLGADVAAALLAGGAAALLNPAPAHPTTPNRPTR